MTRYLYVLAIGPIQDFIAAARRTRDLWFGSYLLSELSKAAAQAIATKPGCRLIFPNPENVVEDLKPSTAPDAFNVANIILAEVNIDDGAREAFDTTVKNAAKERWTGTAAYARKIIDTAASGAINNDIWKEQVKDVIEFYSAWVPLKIEKDKSGKEIDNYREARKRLMYILAGRKSIRNFTQPKSFSGVPKSSLDGARESVFIKGTPLSKAVALRLRLKSGEQLCAVGLTKRLGGGKVPFPSVVRVACDPWIRGVSKSGGQEILDKIAILCTGENSFASGTGKRKKTGRFYPAFPFDGQVFYPDILAGLIKDLEEFLKNPKIPISDQEKSETEQRVQYLLSQEIESIAWRKTDLYEDLVRLKEIERCVRYLQQKEKGLGLGIPSPYYAILSADGDGMGKVISSRNSADEHRAFSRTLAGFAGKARDIVEGQYHGCMVYSGGDDVFAFLPVDQCIGAARALHNEFGKRMRKVDEKDTPTLSVGIAIGHALEPLEDLVDYAREAEHAAKDPDRNGLAIHLYTRGSVEPIKIREQWKISTDTKSLDNRLETWISMHLNERIPDRAAYNLLELSRDYMGWNGSVDSMRADIRRLFKRKRADTGIREIDETDITSLMEGIDSYDTIQSRAHELIITRRFASIRKQAERPARGGCVP